MAARAPDFTWECRCASGAAAPPYGGECIITRSEKRWKWRQKPVCLPLRASPSNTYEDGANDPRGGASNSRQAARMLRHTKWPALSAGVQPRHEQCIFFRRGISQRGFACGRRVVIRHRFGKLAHCQIPHLAVNPVVEVRAAWRLRREDVSTEMVLHDKRSHAAMILRRFDGDQALVGLDVSADHTFERARYRSSGTAKGDDTAGI